VFAQLKTLAAQGEVIYQDDTPVRILSLIKENRQAEAQANGQSQSSERTGMYTTGLVVQVGERTICLYVSGRFHAGENLEALLAQREAGRAKPLVMSNALSRNEAEERALIRCHCLAHRPRVLRPPNLDEQTRQFWGSYGASTYYKAAYEPVMNRLAPFFRPPLSISLSTPSFSLNEQLNRHARVLLYDLSRLRGLVQEVVGQLLIAQLQQTFLPRDYLRGLLAFPPYFLYIDEFQKYAGHCEESLIEILNSLGKFKIGIPMAHQTTANISPRLRSDDPWQRGGSSAACKFPQKRPAYLPGNSSSMRPCTTDADRM